MTDPPPRVTVIIPCYNAGLLLDETLASLQNEEPHELVIVDDGSDDLATHSALERARAAGATVIRQENRGAAAARWTGVEAARTRFVLTLDADDLIVKDGVGALADVLDADPTLAIAWGDAIEFGPWLATVGRGRDLDPWLITYVNFVGCPLIARREVVLSSTGWGSSRSFEDWSFAMAVAEAGGRGRNIGRPIVFYRIHAGGKVAIGRKRYWEVYRFLQQEHPDLFRERRRNWRRSSAPLTVRFFLPVVDLVTRSWPDRRRQLIGLILAWSSADYRWQPPDAPGHPVLVFARRRLAAVARHILHTLPIGGRPPRKL